MRIARGRMRRSISPTTERGGEGGHPGWGKKKGGGGGGGHGNIQK